MTHSIYPKTAMLLAAGLGSRMKPLTDSVPKPLVKIHGKALLDRALDALEKAFVKRVIINIHHLAEQIADHITDIQKNYSMELILSDERATLLDSAGAIVKALALLGKEPFFVLNSDTFWCDTNRSNLLQLAEYFQPHLMDMALLTIPLQQANDRNFGDFLQDDNHRLMRRALSHEKNAVLYAGALLVNPVIFNNSQPIAHSLNLYFNQAIAEKRLFGYFLQGKWYSVDTIAMIKQVEQRLLLPDLEAPS